VGREKGKRQREDFSQEGNLNMILELCLKVENNEKSLMMVTALEMLKRKVESLRVLADGPDEDEEKDNQAFLSLYTRQQNKNLSV
jgi:hypothetical protein